MMHRNEHEDFTAKEADVTGSTYEPDNEVLIDENRKFYLVLIATGVLGTLSNAFVVLVIRKFTRMTRRISGVLILNQSLVDGVYSFCMMCCYLVFYCYGFGLPGGRTVQMLYCKLILTEWLPWGLLSSSSFNLLAVNMERYFSVVWPIFHKMLTFNKFALPSIVVVWTYGPVSNLIWAQVSTYIEDDQCMLYAFHDNLQLSTSYGVTVILTSFFIPLALMVYFYCHMVWVLRSRAPKSSQKNLLKTLMIVTLAFIACWLMDMTCWTLYHSGVLQTYEGGLYYSGAVLLSLNACVNPFIYIIHYRQFKAGVRKMLRRGQVAPDDFSRPATSTTMPRKGDNSKF